MFPEINHSKCYTDILYLLVIIFTFYVYDAYSVSNFCYKQMIPLNHLTKRQKVYIISIFYSYCTVQKF